VVGSCGRVGGEEDPDRRAGYALDLGPGKALVEPEEHRPVQRPAQDQEREVAGGHLRVLHPEQATAGQVGDERRQLGEGVLRRPLVVTAGERRQPPGLPDDQPA
jgi:hypothetical protein